ncbi:uncharacterized protein LOC122534744 isoform X1 [Frieseomelitta varia]|uniref:uncharacterized protein LOC122534744 isoform X1 n=1 Tax=Frieseomelitta varia TaxID=561572 RepID=UPI001CB69858|nr:uncharacterized protein LOC122534744 isoform X1 [Frieseomelitta varia]
MKFLIIALLLVFLQIQHGLFAKLESKENQTLEDQQRSIRVHRVSDRDFPKTDFSQIKNSIKEIMIKQALILGGEEFEKLLTDFPNLGNLVRHESQLFKELNAILMELIQGGTVTLKNIDLEISEMMDTSTSSASIKPVSKTNKSLENILNSLEQADTYQQDVQESQENSSNFIKKKSIMIVRNVPSLSVSNFSTFFRGVPTQIESISELELKTMKNLLDLDNVLMEIQKHLTFVRSVFDRLCRKHHSTLPTQSSPNNLGKFTPMNQPKKVSIL